MNMNIKPNAYSLDQEYRSRQEKHVADMRQITDAQQEINRPLFQANVLSLTLMTVSITGIALFFVL